MRRYEKTLATTLLAAVLAAPFSAAQAAMVLELSDGSTTYTISDNGVGDLSGLDGLIQFSGSFGAFDIDTAVGTSKPAIGSDSLASMHLDSFRLTSNLSAGPFPSTVWFKLTDTDFTPTGWARAYTGFGGESDGSVTLQSYIDFSNTEFGTGTQLADFSFGSGAFSGSATTAVTLTDPFSLTLIGSITHTAAGQVTSFNSDVTVPEPGSLVLMGLGLIGVGFVGWRMGRRRS